MIFHLVKSRLLTNFFCVWGPLISLLDAIIWLKPCLLVECNLTLIKFFEGSFFWGRGFRIIFFTKQKPWHVSYVDWFNAAKLLPLYNRNYKSYDSDVFRSEIQTFCPLNETDLGLLKESIFCIFNKHAPIKKYLRVNEAPSGLKNSIILLWRDQDIGASF